MKLIPTAEQIFKQQFEILKKKNQDYAGTEGEFKNFDDPDLVGKIPYDAIPFNLRGELRKKWTRFNVLFLENAPPNFESLDDTIGDMINYLVILKAYRKIQQQKEQNA